MTLEEAIKHCEEVAEENTKACDRSICFQNEYNNIECDECYIEGCNKCASEHRQLAEWLKELKKYRAVFEKVGRILSDNGYTIDDLDTIFGKVNGEVNADE